MEIILGGFKIMLCCVKTIIYQDLLDEMHWKEEHTPWIFMKIFPDWWLLYMLNILNTKPKFELRYLIIPNMHLLTRFCSKSSIMCIHILRRFCSMFNVVVLVVSNTRSHLTLFTLITFLWIPSTCITHQIYQLFAVLSCWWLILSERQCVFVVKSFLS